MKQKIKEEEEASSPKPADLEIWWLHVRKAVADLFELQKGVPPASTHNLLIKTNQREIPAYNQAYRISVSEHLELETQAAELLANCWGTYSNSQFTAPVSFAIQADGSELWMFVDYSGLNAITTKDPHPLPYTEYVVEQLHGSKVFTKLDVASGDH